jgi:hypothetical protein
MPIDRTKGPVSLFCALKRPLILSPVMSSFSAFIDSYLIGPLYEKVAMCCLWLDLRRS